MKNRILFPLLFAFAVLSVMGFTTCNEDIIKTDCCKEYPYEMHISAMGLMQACQDLVKNNGVTICDYHAPAVAHVIISAISASGYGYKADPPKPKSGVVSFTHSYYKDSTIFRTAWQSGNFESYPKGCAPNPNIYPFTGTEENHLFELGLIPVADYQAAPGDYKKFTIFRKGPGGIGGGTYVLGVIKTQNITAIENIRLEPATGYISTTEPTWYRSLSSSKGFVCDVTYIRDIAKQDTITTPCYIINNNDAENLENDRGGSLWWKVRKKCQ